MTSPITSTYPPSAHAFDLKRSGLRELKRLLERHLLAATTAVDTR
jgi:hypothetical protein